MLPHMHVKMMRLALDHSVSARAMREMIRANIGVDAVWNQLGRHELHFDNNAFEESYAYIEGQRMRIRSALEAGRPGEAWQAFGRLTHTVQDFYSHSNYVDLWMSCQPPGWLPPASGISPLDETLIGSPALRSGRVFLPLEITALIPLVGSWIARRAPRDSHAYMNLDSERRGPMFEYAFQAAVKRTRLEYESLALALPQALLEQFRDLPA